MLDVYFCMRNDHDLRLVGLAALICVMTAVAIVLFLRQARAARGAARTRWLMASAVVSGFGIWATHFTAMMGYDPGVILGYALVPTILSLLIAVATITVAYAIALRSTGFPSRIVAGLIGGLGVAAMHYLGVYAIEMGADFRWSPALVVASILLAILPAPFVLVLALDRDGRRSGAAAMALIVLGVFSLHFTGMAGLSLVPDRIEDPDNLLISSPQMGLAIAIVALGLLAMSIMAVASSIRLRAAMDASEREFKALVQGISDCAIYMLQGDGRVASWNAGAERLKGYTRTEAIGLELANFYSPQDRAAGLPARGMEIARHEGRFNAEGWRYRKDGSRFWAHVTIEAVHDESGFFQGFAKITRDMTRMKEDQEQLKALTGKLDSALTHMHQGLCMFDADERLILANGRVTGLIGAPGGALPLGMSFEQVAEIAVARRIGRSPTRPELDEALARHRACIANPEGGEIVATFADGMTLSIAHHAMPDGGWVSTFDDITERRRAEQRIEHLALHDTLTDLPNRTSYNDRLDTALAIAERNGGKVAVIGIDLDRFKEVNDLYGHSTGDAVLRLLADRMSAFLQDGETVARFGGDEFAAFKSFAEDGDLADFLQRLDGALAARIDVDGVSIHPGASIGVAIFPADGADREQVVNNADLAMYRAKITHGHNICFYEGGMDEAARERRTIANDLREAIDRDELSVVYQVQKAVATEHVVGYEALLRWHRPGIGWISPADFVPIAEESSEILRIGAWVLRQACAEAAHWPEPWRIAVNLSPVQLMHADLPGIVAEALGDSGLSAERLELEITETAFVADKPRALDVLRQIKALGVSIAIDDFGTGYSSLDTLNSFPFDKIKIDRSFLMNSDSSHQARAIIRAVLALGHSLDMPVLAEGLETESQLQLLRDEQCDEAQGFLWGRPGKGPVGVEAEEPAAAQ